MQRPASTPSVTSMRWLRRGMVDDLHDAADGSGLGIARAVDQPRNARMHDRSGAHRAGLQRDVKLAAAEPVIAQRARGFAQRQNLGVRVGSLAEITWFQPRPTMLSLAHHHRADRNLARNFGQPRQPQRLFHPALVGLAGAPRISSSLCIGRAYFPAGSCCVMQWIAPSPQIRSPQ